jgi:hypothetical protein
MMERRDPPKLGPLTVVCAWCQRTKNPGDSSWTRTTGSMRVDGTLVSHGICPICMDEQNGEPTEAELSRYYGYNR